jgi:hypothetical protein
VSGAGDMATPREPHGLTDLDRGAVEKAYSYCEIILVNHLYSERGVAAAIERLCARPSRKLGLRPEFPFARLTAWATAHGGAELIERRPIKPFGIYTLVRFRRLGENADRLGKDTRSRRAA